jgi:hypothetical protein
MAFAAGIVAVLAMAGAVVAAVALRPPGDRWILTGDRGARAELNLVRAWAEPAEVVGRQEVTFLIRMRSTGDVWVGSRLDAGASVTLAGGGHEPANSMASLSAVDVWGSVSPAENPGWQLQPGEETERSVVFWLPEGAVVTRLSITLPMGDATPVAEWDIPAN